jgi:hypothetical protein
MRGSILTIAIANLTLAMASAHAQTTILNGAINPPPINWTDPIIHVATTFRIAVATKDTESLNDVKAQETGRRTLYGMAEAECAILTETFKGQCRLNTFTITSLISPPSASVANSTMSATAVYELKPQTHAPE